MGISFVELKIYVKLSVGGRGNHGTYVSDTMIGPWHSLTLFFIVTKRNLPGTMNDETVNDVDNANDGKAN